MGGKQGDVMAGSVNKVILVGNLGADPEIRRTQDGRPIANLNIATSETWRDRNSGERKEKTEWHRVVIFNEGLCKVAEQYLKKGAKVYIEGALQTRKWQDQNGQDKYSTEIVLQGFNSTLTMLDGRGEGGGSVEGGGRGGRGGGDFGGGDYGGGDDYGQPSQPSGGRGAASGNRGGAPSGGGGNFSRDLDDDIPFWAWWYEQLDFRRPAFIGRPFSWKLQGCPRTIHDKLGGKCGEDHTEQSRKDCSASRAEHTIEPVRNGKGCEDEPKIDGDNADQLRPIEGGLQRTSQKDRGRDRAGAGNQRQGEGKDRDVADMILRDRDLGRLFLSVLPPLEHHLEGDPEQQQAAGNAECANGDAENAEHACAEQGEGRQNEEGDQRASKRHLLALGAVHASREADEQGSQTWRIDGDKQCREGIDQRVCTRHMIPGNGSLSLL